MGTEFMRLGERNKVDQVGFTLIELMIVIVIVAVLVTVGLPAYQNQLKRSHRAAAKAEILEIANRQEHYLLSNRSYTSSATDLSYTLPSDVSPNYSFSLSTASASSVPYFKITFSPLGSQTSDGELVFDSEGVRTPSSKWKR